MGAFGDKLRHQRERRGLSLDAISSTTKISTRMLRAIEEEHFEQLPGGVFNKGFVRAYARHVGLDEEEAVGEYLDALRETQAQSQAILPNFRAPAMRPAAANEPPRNGSTVPETVDDSIAEERIDYGRTAERRIRKDRRRAERRIQDQPDQEMTYQSRLNEDRPDEDDLIMLERSEERHRETPVASAENIQYEEAPVEQEFDQIPSAPPSFLNLSDAPPSRPARPHYSAAELAPNDSGSNVRWEKLAIPLLLLTLVLAVWGFHRRNQNAAASQATVSSQTTPVSATASTTAAAQLAASTSVKPAAAAQPAGEADADVDVNPPARHAHVQTAKPVPPPTFTLVIRAAQTSWIAITADGEPVARETLIAPAHTSVRANHEITVKTGNAAGISFSLGHLDFPAQGNAGEVRSYTFDANGLRDNAAVQTAPSTR